MSEPIRVVVVDDHDIVRSGLAFFLKTRDDMDLVGEALNGEEALEMCAQLQPDVVLMDLMMPRMGGVETTAIIRETYPDTQVIALTSFKDKDLIQAALQAGAISYVLKNVSIEELADAIQAAVRGKSTLSPEVTQMLIAAATEKPRPNYNLTERELEVLALVVEGKNNGQIAEELTISRNTVKFHVSVILSKLNVSSRTEAATLALQQGLLE